MGEVRLLEAPKRRPHRRTRPLVTPEQEVVTAAGILSAQARVWGMMTRGELSSLEGNRQLRGLNIIREGLEGAQLDRRIDAIARVLQRSGLIK